MMHIEQPGNPNPVSGNPDQPVYQVTFWERLSEPAHLPAEQRGFEAAEWKLRDAEVTEVLDWAEREVGPGRTYTVHVASTSDDGNATMLRLLGQDPTIVASSQGYFTRASEG